MITVTGHRVLIKEDPVEKVSKGGIVVVTNDNNEKLERAALQHGVIVAIGPDCWKAYRTLDSDGIERNGRPWVRVGDYVLFARHAGRFVADPTNGEMHLIMNDEDILGVITEGSTLVPENKVRDNLFNNIDEEG